MKRSAQLEINKNRRVGLLKQSNTLLLLLIISFGSILTRLFSLQIIKGTYYRRLSDENRIRLVSRPPIRGRLLDRNGKILADSRLTYSLSIQPRLVEKKDWPLLRNKLSELIGISKKKLDLRYNNKNNNEPYRITLASNLKPEQVLRFREKESSLNGAQVDIQLIRYYPYKTFASHVLGYTQPLTNDEYKVLVDKGYQLIDRIGRTGIEAAYESLLRGKWGG